jgi:hypothetical protein
MGESSACDRGQMIAEIGELVRQACARETNVYGYGIWTHHIVPVVKTAKELALALGADAEIVEIASLLHDYAGIKDKRLTEEHHLHGAAAAEAILRGYAYPPERIARVQHCIVAHRSSVRVERQSPEAECVSNADALVHFQQMPSLLHTAYMQRGMNIDEGVAWVRGKLQRDWAKLSPQVQERYGDYCRSVLRALGPAEGER